MSDTFDEQIIESESPEINVGENISWGSRIKSALPALTSRNYRLYFAGQLVSLTGTWLQVVAEGWLVFQLTHSALFVGIDAAAALIPSLFLSLLGGVIVDRYPKKIILICTQTAAMMLAFTLGLLAIFHLINVWGIIVLSFLLGVVNAVDAPARQAYVTELIDNKASLSSAIALNAGMFNAARVIGPTIAGLLIAIVGAGMAFVLNGISYIFVIVALFFITTSTAIEHRQLHPIQAIKEGIAYTMHHQTIRLLIVLSGVVSIFGWSYSTLMPVIATQVFHLSAAGLGYLYAVAGAGALLATFFISAYAGKFNHMAIIMAGNLIFALALLLFSFTHNTSIAAFLLFLVGGGLVMQFAMANTVIQHLVDDHMRGRVLSVYTLVFLGLSPFGSLEIGYAAEHLGTQAAIRISACIVLAFGLYLFSKRKIIFQRHAAQTPGA